MRFSSFDLNEPLPELREPHALAILRPWIDVGNVGTIILSRLVSHYKAKELGILAKPESYFDFTRYRPTIYLKEGRREIKIPNTTISYARSDGPHDFLFLRLLEPHMQAETYFESVIELFKRFGVKRYLLLGSMYDMVPHTRPLLVTGSGSSAGLQSELDASNVFPSDYVGPTTMAALISQNASRIGMETSSLIVHLPNYLAPENDYRGEVRLLEVLSSLYGLPVTGKIADRAKEQADSVSQMAEQILEQEPSYRPILTELESSYESRVSKTVDKTKLSPELEQLLHDLSKRFSQN